MNACEKRILQVKGWGVSSGKGAYLRMLRGESITRGAAIKAKCAECCAGYADGRADCEVPLCPLYPFMPYKAAVAPVLDDEGDGAGRLPSPDEIAA